MYNVTAKPNTKIIRILSEYRKSSIPSSPEKVCVCVCGGGGGCLLEGGSLIEDFTEITKFKT